MRTRPLPCLPEEMTLAAARWVERLAGWRCELRCDVVHPGLTALGIDPTAELLLVPAEGPLWRSQIDAFVAANRCDALIVQIGWPGLSPEIVGTCVQWHRGCLRWHHASPFWLSETNDLWLYATCVEGFRLTPSPLRISTAPWASVAQQAAGIQRANRSLLSEIAR